MPDDRPRFSGRIPASGAPLNARTLALRPNGQSISQGDLTSSDAVANAVYSFLQQHPDLGVPEQGQQNLAETARMVEQNTPWGQGEEAIKSARSGDLVGTASGILGALPIAGASVKGAKLAKETAETVGGNLAKRAVLTGGKEAVESAAPEAVEAATSAIKGRVRATPTASVPDTVAATAQPPARNMQQVPDIRGVPVDQAIQISRQQPHVIPLPGGGFVGAPRSMRTMADVEAERAAFDKYVDDEVAGGDWYDRARSGLNELTGRDPVKNKMMTGMEGTWSAGVDPRSELGYVIKEANNAVVGAPRRANYTTQHNSLLDAIASADPSDLMHGRKTGQYAKLLAFDQGPPGATGVNDFRYANQRGFLPEEGSLMRDGDISLTEAQHRWLDHETALAVDRANLRQLGGRSDWTGEEIQAMPWVRQKAEALAAAAPQRPYPLSNYQAGLKEALKTPPDYAPNYRFNETFETQPGEDIVGHKELASSMTDDQKEQYARFTDPTTGFGSSMTDPATGRDILYGGQQVYGGPSGTEPTGVSPYVDKSVPMQGFYPNNAGKVETNPGQVARPLVSFNTEPATGKVLAEGPPQAGGELPFAEREYPKVKSLSPESEDMTRTAAYVRAFMNDQQSGAGHILYPDSSLGVTNAFFTPLDRPASVDELIAHQAAGAKYGLGDVSDTGSGITTTDFMGGQPVWTPKTRKTFLEDMTSAAPADAGAGFDARRQSIYEPIDWNARDPGAGDLSRELISRVTKNPQVAQAYDRNPLLPPQVQANAARYKEFEPQTGKTAEDIWNSQQLMGEGPGWIQKMQDILEGRATIPATTAAGVALFPAAGLAAPGQQQSPPSIGSSPGFDDWWQKLQAQRFADASGS